MRYLSALEASRFNGLDVWELGGLVACPPLADSVFRKLNIRTRKAKSQEQKAISDKRSATSRQKMETFTHHAYHKRICLLLEIHPNLDKLCALGFLHLQF
jgi:hypothetical protein